MRPMTVKSPACASIPSSPPPRSPSTTDLCDAHPDVQVCEPVFSDFGKRRAFFGYVKPGRE